MAAVKPMAMTPSDGRGKHRNRENALSAESIAKIDAHIQNFPFNIEHYGLVGEWRRHLSADLGVLKMYEH